MRRYDDSYVLHRKEENLLQREEVRSRRDPGLMMWISIWGRTREPVLSISSSGKLLNRGC